MQRQQRRNHVKRGQTKDIQRHANNKKRIDGPQYRGTYVSLNVRHGKHQHPLLDPFPARKIEYGKSKMYLANVCLEMTWGCWPILSGTRVPILQWWISCNNQRKRVLPNYLLPMQHDDSLLAASSSSFGTTTRIFFPCIGFPRQNSLLNLVNKSCMWINQ